MFVLENIKQNIKEGSHFKRRPHKAMDWIGVAILLSIGAFVGLFLLQVIGSSVMQTALLNDASNQLFERAQFKYNAVHGDSTPQKTYEQARQALLSNDLDGVLATIHPEYLYKYEDGLREAATEGKLPEAGERLTPLKELIDGDPNSIEIGYYVVYEIEPISGNNSPNPLEGYSEAVTFVRDKYGVWKIAVI